MASYNLQNVSPQGFVSGAAIGINRVVAISAANTVIVTAAIATVPLGVATTAATAAGELVTVQQFGKVKCVASAAVTIGDELMPTASGAGKVSTLAGATARSIGQALTAATADGDVIEVQLNIGLKSPVGS